MHKKNSPQSENHELYFYVLSIYLLHVLKTQKGITTYNMVTPALSVLRNSEKNKNKQVQDTVSLSGGGIWKESKMH